MKNLVLHLVVLGELLLEGDLLELLDLLLDFLIILFFFVFVLVDEYSHIFLHDGHLPQ